MTQMHLKIQSSMLVPPHLQLHPTHDRPQHCTLFAVWQQKTGTLILQTVLCNGRHYDLLEISKEDLQKFYDELRYEITQLEF